MIGAVIDIIALLPQRWQQIVLYGLGIVGFASLLYKPIARKTKTNVDNKVVRYVLNALDKLGILRVLKAISFQEDQHKPCRNGKEGEEGDDNV